MRGDPLVLWLMAYGWPEKFHTALLLQPRVGNVAVVVNGCYVVVAVRCTPSLLICFVDF